MTASDVARGGESVPLYSAGTLRKAWIGWRWTATTCTADGTVVEQGKGWERMLLWAQVERNRWLTEHGAMPLFVTAHFGRTDA